MNQRQFRSGLGLLRGRRLFGSASRCSSLAGRFPRLNGTFNIYGTHPRYVLFDANKIDIVEYNVVDCRPEVFFVIADESYAGGVKIGFLFARRWAQQMNEIVTIGECGNIGPAGDTRSKQSILISNAPGRI